MKIYINNQSGVKLSLLFLKTIALRAGQVLKLPVNSQISCALVNNSTIKKLNKNYRGINEVTDVLAFGPGKDKFIVDNQGNQGKYLGEVVIGYPQAKKQARQQGHSVKKELTILLIHGILHLAGYDHRTEAERLRMDRVAERIMDKNPKS